LKDTAAAACVKMGRQYDSSSESCRDRN